MVRQQGDILIKKIRKIPEGAKQRDGNVLVELEETNNKYMVTHGSVYEHYGRVFCILEKPAKIINNGTKAITITEGIYEIIIKNKFSPFVKVIFYYD